MKNIKKSKLSTSSKTGELSKLFIRPRRVLLRGIAIIAIGLFFWWRWTLFWQYPVVFSNLLLLFALIVGCTLIFRAKLGNQQVLAHQISIIIGDSFMFFIGFVSFIYLWATPSLVSMVVGITIIIISIGSIIHCLYMCVKLEKYKVNN